MTRGIVIPIFAALAALTTQTGCFWVAPPVQDGAISFLWSFDGETRCSNARVSQLGVEILRGTGTTAYSTVVACNDAAGGLTIEDFRPGNYTIRLDAFGAGNVRLYAGDFDVVVRSGETTDAGTLSLRQLSDPALGAVQFEWRFDGVESCVTAGVDELRIELRDRRANTTAFEQTFACYSGGRAIENIEPGEYDLWIDAFSAGGVEPLYLGDAVIFLDAGETLDLGVINLLSPIQNGSLVFEWGFRYPGTMAQESCAQAGVVEVDVFVTRQGGGDAFAFTFDCTATAAGAAIDDLPAGTYSLELDAYGRFNNQDHLLYRSPTIPVQIVAGAETDGGFVELEREPGAFGDVLVAWLIPGGSCAALGMQNVTVTLNRLLATTEVQDDQFSVPCVDGEHLRQTFVPGTYRIEVQGTGTDGTFRGTNTATIAPGLQTDVESSLLLLR